MLLNSLSLEKLPPQGVLLAGDIVLTVISSDDCAGARFVEGRVPSGTVDLQSLSGPLKLAVCRLTATECHQSLSDQSDDLAALRGDFPLIISDSVGDLATSLEGFSQIRLLNFLLGFCCKAFNLSGDPDFSRNCLALAQLCSLPPGRLKPVAVASDRWTIVRGVSSDAGTSFWGLSSTRVRRLSVIDIDATQSLSVMDRVGADELIMALGDQTQVWRASPLESGVRDILSVKARNDELRAATLRVLIPQCPKVAAVLREQALVSPAEVIRHMDFQRPLAGALEAAISDGVGKIFIRGWLYDPHELIASVELSGLAGVTKLEWADLHRFVRPDLERQAVAAAAPRSGAKLGFVAFVDDPSAGLALQPTLRLKHKSGAVTFLRCALQLPTPAEALSSLLTSVQTQHITKTLFNDCVGPAAYVFHKRCLSDRPKPDAVQIGPTLTAPHTSFIIPLYKNLSFIKFQLAAFANDKDIDAVQLIYILDSPEQASEVEHLLRGLYSLYRLSILLIVMPRNVGYAAANNAGASFALADRLLLLNSDVVPQKAGWLSLLIKALDEPSVGAVGPKLLFEDDSIQHAGLYFQKDMTGTWLNSHFFKGLPRHWPAADISREVPGVTGAAILVGSEYFNAVGGISEDYIIGDYEDSDFCLKIRSLGKQIKYVADAELFHFERRSIELHSGYSGTIACLYNQKLHHERWGEVIQHLSVQDGIENMSLQGAA